MQVSRHLLVLMPEAVLICIGGRIDFANRAALQLFQVEEGALLGQSITAMIHADSKEAVRDRVAMLSGSTVLPPLAGIRIVRADLAVRVVDVVAARAGLCDDDAVLVVVRDTTELLEAKTEVAHSHAELQRLLSARERVQEAERNRIARELHDELQQTLAAIRIDLAAARQRGGRADAAVLALIDQAAGLASTAMESTRRIINNLRPQMLEDLGLLPALEALVSQFRRRTGIDCRLRVIDGPSDDAPLSALVANCLYRVAQEGLSNIARHSQAMEAELRFARMEGGVILMRLSDNGLGMRTDQPRNADSFGLIGMQERVLAVGALLRIDSGIGRGTTIEVVVPAVIAKLAPTLEAFEIYRRRATDGPGSGASIEGATTPRG